MDRKRQYGQKETIWTERDNMDRKIQYGQKETIWTERDNMDRKRQYGQKETRWTERDNMDRKRQYGQGNAGKCKKSSARKNYTEKRKYHPPKEKKKVDTRGKAPSTGHKKVVDVEKMEEGKEEVFYGYHVIHHGVLHQLLGAISCSECYGHASLAVGIDLSKRKGLASCISVSCKACEYISTYHSFLVIKNNNNEARGQNI